MIIRQNPHNPAVRNVIGIVITFRPNDGPWDCDLADVHYKDPLTGNGYTETFGLSCLEPAEPTALMSLADFYDSMAESLRQLAVRLLENASR